MSLRLPTLLALMAASNLASAGTPAVHASGASHAQASTSQASTAPPSTSQASAAQGEDLLARFMHDGRPARAVFTQQDGKGVARGEMIVGPQGKLRWAQTAPYASLLVSNGHTAWQVDTDLMQATRLDARMTEGWSGVFGSRATLEKTYTIEQQGQRITLKPKRSDGVKGTIDFDRAGNPVVVRFATGLAEQNKDATTEIHFAQWTRLSTTPKGLFDYTPTKGMDVIGAD